MYSNYGMSGDYTTVLIVYAVAIIIQAIIFGLITRKINKAKGRDGGFAWGFWLGAIGIIVVACRRAVGSND